MADLKKLAHPYAQRAALAVGRATSAHRVLPEALIAGAQRCGTTSMFRALVQHPLMLRPILRKGVHYFDTGYDQGIDWYRAHFPTRWAVARAGRAGGGHARTFESSPYYLFHPSAPVRIASALPEVRVIVLVRDPVERAYSAHAHEFARGYEDRSFEQALELEEHRLAGQSDRLRSDDAAYSHAHQHQAYLARGRYADQLDRMAAAVGRDRILVVDSHDFFETPEPAFTRVLDFLDLPEHRGTVFDRHNARPRSAMDPELRAQLEHYFSESDERLVPWLGGLPSWRR